VKESIQPRLLVGYVISAQFFIVSQKTALTDKYELLLAI